ncbi:hypothetical protein [Streptomyces sp. NBC_00859]|uniref:hypothetical protein n=1 Tax=Streptomyces sp. NBC_00859 TaxID=2903682 RepID=UPI00386541CC|nr:hypothetical protein OG584_32625 [Streptomyces sp. NBC_00859]
MDTGAARGRRTALLLAVCAVLLGLFLMHGAPAAAAGGCHGAMSMDAVMPGGHDDSAMVPSAAIPAAAHPGPAVRSTTESGMRGAVCVSTPARDLTPLRSAGLMGVAAPAAPAARSLPGRPARAGRTCRRGPPISGRSLLLRVCVARA